MPKQTFLNLDQRKQAKLIMALKKEFSRAPLHAASIANIVKEASIPRGSFYQYFEDKEDALLFLIDLLSQEYQRDFLTCISQANGDLFESFLNFFKLLINKSAEPDRKQFFFNAVLSQNHKLEQAFVEMVKKNQKMFDFFKAINTEELSITSVEEFRHVIKILVAVSSHNIVHTLITNTSVEQAVEDFTKELEILKNGLKKK